MAEVVAAHVLFDADSCTCDEMFYDYRLTAEQIKVEHSLHVEERLAASGYGKLEDATETFADRMAQRSMEALQAKYPRRPE